MGEDNFLRFLLCYPCKNSRIVLGFKAQNIENKVPDWREKFAIEEEVIVVYFISKEEFLQEII